MSDENLVDSNVTSEETTEVAAEVKTEEAPVVESKSYDWKSEIPSEYAEDPSLADIKDLSGLVKSYVSSQRMLGSSVRIPGEDASQEQIQSFYEKVEKVPGVVRLPEEGNEDSYNQFYNTLGRPTEPDGYTFDVPEGVATEEQLAQFRNLAHKHGLTNKQAKVLVDFELEKYNEAQEYNAGWRTYAEQTLKERWGNDYQNRLEGANNVLADYKEKYPDEYDHLMAIGAGNNPIFADIVSKAAQSMQESGHVQPNAARVNYGLTPEEAQARIKEVMENQSHAYHDEEDPKHNEAVKKMQNYYAAAFPE